MQKTKYGLLLMLTLAGTLTFVSARSANATTPIQFGLTKAVFLNDTLLYEKWSRYLESKFGRPVKFVRKRSYHDIQQLLRLGELDAAWICGDPYVRGQKEGILEYVATPVIHQTDRYQIYLIVPADSEITGLQGLKGKIFAFSDPESVSFDALVGGFLSGGKSISPLDSYFDIHFFTYDHVATVQAVADKLADGGSVDGHVWEALAQNDPALVRRTKVIARSVSYGLPPVVTSWQSAESFKSRLRSILGEMALDSEGRAILDILQVNRFEVAPDGLYDSIRDGPARRAFLADSNVR